MADDDTTEPTGKRRTPPWAVVAAAVAAAVAGGVTTALVLNGDDADDEPRAAPVTAAAPDPHADCVDELFTGALMRADARTDRERRDLIMTWGAESPEWQAMTRAVTPYVGEAVQHGRDQAQIWLLERVERECDQLVAAATTTTTAVPDPEPSAPDPLVDTPPPPTEDVPIPTADEAREVATEVLETWQAGDIDTLDEITGPNVVEVLGDPDPNATVSGCAVEDPPIGSGTVSDPYITAVCTLDTSPPVYLWLGPTADGTLRVLNASNVF